MPKRSAAPRPARNSPLVTIVVCCDSGYPTIGMTIMTAWNNIDADLCDLRVLSVVLRKHNLTRATEVPNTSHHSSQPCPRWPTRRRVAAGEGHRGSLVLERVVRGRRAIQSPYRNRSSLDACARQRWFELKLSIPAASVSVMSSSDAVKVVDPPQSKRLEWWAKEEPACNEHERRADQ
jgi:hypothetical protein